MSTRRDTDVLRSVQLFFARILPDPWKIWLNAVPEGTDPVRPFAIVEQVSPTASVSGAAAGQELTMAVTVSLYLEQGTDRQAAVDAALRVREDVWIAVKVGPRARRPTTDRIALYSYQPRCEIHRLRVGASGGTFTVTVRNTTTVPLPWNASAEQVASAVGVALVDDGQLVSPGDVHGQDRGASLWDLTYQGQLAGQTIGPATINGTNLLGAGADSETRTLLHGAAVPWRGDSDFARVDSFSQTTVHDPADPTYATVPVDLRLTFVRGLPLPLDLRIVQRLRT